MAINGLIWSSKPEEHFFGLTILALDFQRPKNAGLQMSETVGSNILFRLRFRKAYQTYVLNCLRA